MIHLFHQQAKTPICELHQQHQLFLREMNRAKIRPDRPRLNVELHETNTQRDLQTLCSSIDLTDPGEKYLIVLDLDGTVFPKFGNLILNDLEKHPVAFPHSTFVQITELMKKYPNQFKVVILTARGNLEFIQSPSLQSIEAYTGFGFTHQRINPNPALMDDPIGIKIIDKFERDFLQYYDGNFIDELAKLGLKASDIKLGGESNGFYISFNDKSFPYRKKIIEALSAAAINILGYDLDIIKSSDEYLIIFNNKKLDHIRKAHGFDFVYKNEIVGKEDPNLKVIVIGDTDSDLKTMVRAKEKLPPNQVVNVAVGPEICNHTDVDLRVNSHIDIQRFFDTVYSKFVSKLN